MENFDPKIGERFQEETKYFRPAHWPRYAEPALPSLSAKIVRLSPNLPQAGPNVWTVLKSRRSIRDYLPTPLPLPDLANLLWATQGITGDSSSPWYRTAPSAGALHPIDTYLVIRQVKDLEPGIYFLRLSEFALEMKKSGDFSHQIAHAALEQEMARSAAVVFVWVAVIRRSSQKYRQRAYRYIYLDCGHIAQNLYLAATALGLGCCTIAAFFDDEVNALVAVDGCEQTAIYLAAVGPREG
jgi:SagB-type dehydrogenase family enzyme